MTETVSLGTPDVLRERMVEQLRERGALTSSAVEAAFRTVPRHLFVPEKSPEEVYGAPEGLFTKHNERGKPVSSVSAPWLHARMLEAAQVAPGMRVLEIGSGGCNAALLAELVGEQGSVTTVDIDRDITARARERLAEAGYGQVRVREADGARLLQDAPAQGFDRIIVTVGAADLSSAWMDQLAPAGRLVVPLRFRGLSRTIAFAREQDHLRSDTLIVSGFVAMQGDSAHAPRVVRLAGQEVRLVVDEDQPADDEALTAAFAGPWHEQWTGVELGPSGGLLPRLEVWLAGAVAPYGRLRATPAAAERGLVGWVLGRGAPAAWNHNSLAYVTLRRAPHTPQERYELGVIAHGPDRERLAARLADTVTRLDREARDAAEPVVRAYRRDGRGPGPVEVTVDKPSVRLVIT
ncbi:methyltransferase, FxLD system [Streptomyces sp. 110]|uniref:Protein-L-isoaspartate O-methyltransferase n=1 Tax=Streptomyces endocoffeicus TaxID=2898945 RepID=A0ABS1PTM0_9ACTN|nr:methyltransferase, FxLD system [Streptomyces endocoffeicus]MBL1115252.1 methyltransferase, FxLD system [Streptomyces endocoffeicus]